MLLFCTKGGRNKWGQRSTEHGSRSVPRTGQIRMKTGGNNEAWLETGVRIQGSRPGIMLTCIVRFMAITPIVSEREGLQ